jgi:DNA-binding NarL/FixJ family response regulator
VLGLVEAAHSSGGDLQAWCERMLEGALPLFSRQLVGVAVSTRREARYELTACASNLPVAIEQYRAQFRDGDAREFDPFMRFPRQVGTMSAINGSDATLSRVRDFTEIVGMPDTLGLIAIVDNVSLTVGVAHPRRIQIPATEERLLSRVALHMEAGLQLRLNPGSEIAVLHPDGRLLHAAGPLRESARSRTRLRQHVSAVERSRTWRRRQSSSALEAWSALISGHWGLVERVDSDGKRLYSIVEATRARRLLALAPLEAEIVELSARGLTGKAVAYALGVSRPSVSHALSGAAFKLGVRNRTELVRLVAQLLGTSRAPHEAALTAAERDVLTLVRLGWTNATIARARGRSQRTVANQVSALLGKLGAPSRRALASIRS